MTCREADTRIDAFLDGTLEPEERDALETHLRECDRCRRESAGLRALLDDAAILPRSREPGRDLWPEIRAEIRRRRAVALEPRRTHGPWVRRALLAAAAVALIVLSSTITWLLREPAEGPAPHLGPAPNAAFPADVRAWETQVVEATRELASALERNRESLAPETVTLLEENLRIIDDAIRESRAALAEDPGNAALGQMLWATYKQKLDLLQQAARWSAES